MRHNYDKLAALNIEVLVIGPDNGNAFLNYWNKESLPFIGLPDPKHSVLNLYGQEVKLLKLGRMPAQILVDTSGIIRFAYYGNSMADIPTRDPVEKALKETPGTG